jgi:N-acetylglucosamine kinase-like BadF-type ATPase
MSYILGVDGGNTKTIALVANTDGTILGVGRSGCSDIYGAKSPEAALSEAYAAVSVALSTAGIKKEALAAGCFSIAGADWREDIEFLEGAFAGYSEKVTVVNDAMGALRAGSPDGTGVVVACGTGAATGARNAVGHIWHSSFWQEPQGAHELGQKAIFAVYRAALGVEPPTSLTPRVLEFFGKQSVEELLYLFTGRRMSHPEDTQVAKVARVLLDEATHGDVVARRIVQAHGTALGDYALVAARRVKIEDTAFSLVLAGGVFRHTGRLLADTLIERVHTASPQARPIFSRFEPAIGALLLAYEAVGVIVNEALLEKLATSAPQTTLFET